MIAYVDTSVVLRIVLAEPEPLREWRSLSTAITSELTQVEALRTIDRARLRLGLVDAEVETQRAQVIALLEGFHLAPIDAAVLDRASPPFPTLIRTLDAMHLASALLVRFEYPELVFATHDVELGSAARALGFRVLGLRGKSAR